jgi:hypothetical protein
VGEGDTEDLYLIKCLESCVTKVERTRVAESKNERQVQVSARGTPLNAS